MKRDFVVFLILFCIGLRYSASEGYSLDLEVTSDIGCSIQRPALCPDGSCYEDYSFCEPVRGCVSSPSFLMCPSGTCTHDFSLCVESNYSCNLENYNRCADGQCRMNCDEIYTNGCPATAPFFCPSGKCGRTMLECTGILNRLQMSIDQTLFMC